MLGDSTLTRTSLGSPSSVRFVADVTDLTAVFEPTVNLVALRRTLSSALNEDACRAVRQRAFRRSFAVDAETAGPAVAEELAGLPHLAADVQHWVEVLADLTGATTVGVRLARLEAAMCPRFHVDHVLVRLVSTYAGRGTEFLCSEHVDRRYLGRGNDPGDETVGGLLRQHGHVQRAERGDVLLLKGEAWPDNAGKGAVHRSPAVEEGSARLVLTLDPL